MTMKGDDFLALIQSDVVLKRVSATGGGEWAGPCPKCGGDDRFRVWPDEGRFWCRQCGSKGDGIEFLRWTQGLGFKEACEHLGIPVPGNGNGTRPKPVTRIEQRPAGKNLQSEPNKPALEEECIFNYLDEQGRTLFQKVRYRTDVKDQRFRQRSINPDGSLSWSVKGVRQVLWNLPGILGADPDEPIFVCEGERDAETADARGYVATTAPNQSGFLRDCEQWQIHEPLRGRDVVIVCDADTPGRRYGYEKAEYLSRHCRSVKVVDLFPFSDDGSDFSDWARDKSREQVQCELGEIIERTPKYKASRENSTEQSSKHQALIQLVSFRELELMDIEPPREIIKGLQPEGLTIVCGPPKKRKSFFEGQKSLAISNGSRFLGHFVVRQGSVLHLALEDSRNRFRDRIIVQSQWQPCPENAFFHNVWPRISRSKKEPCGLDLIRQWLDEQGDKASHVSIDTLQKLRPPGKGQGQTLYERDYEDLGDLQQLASEYHVGITVVHHTRKTESDDDLDMISGSNALAGAADSIIMFKGLRGELDAEIFVTGRDIQEIRGVIQFDPETMLWTWMGDAAQLKMTEARREVWDAMREAKRPLSVRELKDILDKPYRTVQKTVQRMADKLELEKATNHRWQLPDSEAPGDVLPFRPRGET